jgi:excisionase family DNA binding protein
VACPICADREVLMAQKYYSSEETAKALGVSEDEVNQMAQRQQLHGYRDGAQWKFKAEEVEQLVQQRQAQPPSSDDQGESDLLLSELELGPSASSASGTVIGGVDDSAKPAADSDLQLGDDSQATKAQELDSKVAQFEELDLALEEDLTLEDSSVAPSEETGTGSSSVDVGGKELEDDDLVLGGGSGAGSDITIGGDSGISLIDPADSGLSLEEPLTASSSTDESLELGEDDMVGVGETTEAPAEPKAEDDFLLTPLEEVSDEEDSESGSQVIALDLEGDEAATMIAGTSQESGVAAMLDEDLSEAPADTGFGAAVDAAALGTAPLGVQAGGFAEGAPLGAPAAAAALPEAPYSIWNILSLIVCTVFLILVGMMMYDLMRNMWSWDAPYSVNSWLMDLILGR